MKRILSFLILLVVTNTGLARTGARYLIIAPDNFVQTVQPLADWKTKKGVKTMVVPLSVTGNSASQIKSYILNAYNNWEIRPEYILLAGLGAVVPYSGSSDDYYANMTGNYRIELSVGRLPCTTIDQCQNIVNKILNYERTPFISDTGWFRKGTTIVREDYSAYPPTSYPDTEYWENVRYCFTQWLNNGYVHVDSFSKNRGHTSTDVINAINNGRTFVVFRGQTTVNWWSPFGVDPNSTNNGFKLPVIVSGTCATMSLSSTGYQGDRFLNAGTVQNPKGAVGYFGSTVTAVGSGLATYRGKVTKGFFKALFEDKIYSMGDAAKRAKFILDSSYIYYDSTRYREWNLFGDPELKLWTRKPEKLLVIYDSVVLASQNLSFTVSGPEGLPISNALVCLRMDTMLYSWGYTNYQGQISLPTSSVLGLAEITVTAPNYIPFEGQVRIASVLPRDVGVVNLFLLDTVNVGDSVRPVAVVKNFGSQTVSFASIFQIMGWCRSIVYADTIWVLNLVLDDSLTLTFNTWLAIPGDFIVKCSTALNGDLNHFNDCLEKSLFVRLIPAIGEEWLIITPVVKSFRPQTLMKNIEIEVYDPLGRRRYGRLSSGIYFLKPKDRTQTKKILIK